MILLCRAEQVALNFHLFSAILLSQEGYLKPPSADKKDEHNW